MDISEQVKELLAHYSLLTNDEHNHIIRGKLYVSSNDFYEIEMDYTNFPNRFPLVQEVGERIPSKMDRHKYSGKDICCFTTDANAYILLKTKIFTLKDFVKEIVIPYFTNNSFYEINHCYAYATYSHGLKGIIEGYRDILKLNNDFDEIKILEILRDRICGVNLKARNNCFCGSKLLLFRCLNGKHAQGYRAFKLIDENILISDLDKMYREFELSKRLYDLFSGLKQLNL